MHVTRLTIMPARAATVMSAGDGTDKRDDVAETEVTATVVPSFMLSAWTTSGDLTAAFNEEALVVLGGSVVVVAVVTVVVVVAGDDAIDVVVEGESVCDEEVAEMIEVEEAGVAEVEFVDDDDVVVVVVVIVAVVVVVVFGTIVSVLVLLTECE